MTDPDRDDLRQTLSAAADSSINPLDLARRDLKRALPRRFYAQATSGPMEEGFGVLLDGKPVRTPAKAMLVVPTVGLAEALACEWQAQRDLIEPDLMPMTRLCNSAIDGVAGAVVPTIVEIARYADTDLVCYRAGDPAALVEAQSEAWDPVLAFARDDLDARFFCAQGVIYVTQPETALSAVRRAIDSIAEAPGGVFRLAALSVMTNIAGSVLLALAIARKAMAVETAWTAAHVDEDYQASMWGQDDEAIQRRQRRWRDMSAADRVYRLAG